MIDDVAGLVQGTRLSLLRSSAFLDSLGAGLVLHGPDGDIVDASIPACELLGLTRDQLLGRTSYDLRWNVVSEDGLPIPADEHPAMVTLRTGQPCTDVVLGVNTPDQIRRWLSVSSRLLVDDDGAIEGVGVTFLDVTQRLELAGELQESRARYRLLAEHASDLVYELDPDDRFVWVSPSVTPVLGWEPVDLLGRSLTDFLPVEHYAAVLAERRRTRLGQPAVKEIQLRCADGAWLWMAGRSKAVLDPSGGMISRVVSLRDIADQVAAAQQLAESESRYRMLAENASDMVYQLTRDDIITWVSPSAERIFGMSPEALVGTPNPHLVAEEDRGKLVAARDRLWAGDEVEPLELRYLTANGEHRWMSAHARPILDQTGTTTGAVVALSDCHTEVMARRAAQTLSAGNAIIGRVQNERELLEAMCAAAVERGGYAFAWYGRPVDDGAKSVQPAAAADAHRSYLDEVEVSWGDGPLGAGPTGAAIRTGRTSIVNDFATEGAYEPWRDAATAHGFRSSVGLPISIDQEIDGALTVYAEEPNAFDDRNTSALEDLAAQLGLGLRRLRDLEEIARVSAERALLSNAIDQAVDGVIVVDPERRVRYANPAALKLGGRPPGTVNGRPVAAILRSVDDEADEQLRELGDAIEAGRTWAGLVVLRREDSTGCEVEINSGPVDDADGARIAHVIAIHDLTTERRLEADLLQARLDQDRFVALMESVRTEATLEDTVASFIDAANQIHEFDDCFILLTGPDDHLDLVHPRAHLLRWLVRGGAWHLSDLRSRLDSEPDPVAVFDLLSPRTRDALTSLDPVFARELDDAGYSSVGFTLIRYDNRPLGILAVATCAADGHAVLEARRPILAQLGSYASTILGSTAENAYRQAEARARITRIIDTEAFQPHFQAVVEVATGRVQGYEALTRFDDGTRPDIQILEAHSCRMGVELEFACAAACIESAHRLPDDIWVSINLSPQAILDGDVPGLLSGAGRPIVIEITEHEAIESYTELKAALDRCGPIRVAIDDAGAGYASLQHILELEPDIVKLDRALVRNIDRDPARQAMAAGLAHFAAQVGLTLLAEGIETSEEARIVGALDIELAQGYLYARPAPLD